MKLLKLIYTTILLLLLSTSTFAQCPPPVPASNTQSRCGAGTYKLFVSTQTYSCTAYPAANTVYFKWYSADLGGALIGTTATIRNPVAGVYDSELTVSVTASTDY